MVVSKDELLTRIRTSMGDNVSTDENISIIEDVTDTLDDYAAKIADKTDWKAKYDELDKDWRKRYTQRFFNPVETGADTVVDNVDKLVDNEVKDDDPETFDELFKEGE